jgi:hypothetical protein
MGITVADVQGSPTNTVNQAANQQLAAADGPSYSFAVARSYGGALGSTPVYLDSPSQAGAFSTRCGTGLNPNCFAAAFLEAGPGYGRLYRIQPNTGHEQAVLLNQAWVATQINTSLPAGSWGGGVTLPDWAQACIGGMASSVALSSVWGSLAIVDPQAYVWSAIRGCVLQEGKMLLFG